MFALILVILVILGPSLRQRGVSCVICIHIKPGSFKVRGGLELELMCRSFCLLPPPPPRSLCVLNLTLTPRGHVWAPLSRPHYGRETGCLGGLCVTTHTFHFSVCSHHVASSGRGAAHLPEARFWGRVVVQLAPRMWGMRSCCKDFNK